ncbi:MAG: C69 family dipeptidase [Proteobacteria bacterium]|jgi:dipeptidase|nr:C69 family dipeptidase [Pseudomonadota bacterium]
MEQTRLQRIALSLAVCGLAVAHADCADACTNFLISKGATADGSTMITYSADSHELYGELYYEPPGRNRTDTMVDVYEWDTGKYLGQIAQVAETYSVVGNMNEHQVAIGETTFGGREELVNPKAIVDYGSLMYLALARAKTAREAIKVMTDLVAEYGYASAGESFSISDPKEVWILEMIGKGPDNPKGALWVARRIPDGYVSAHANQSRIRKFPLNDKKNTLYAKDVISFARGKGWFEGADSEFSFADAYVPMDYGALRFCEARVWSMFRRVAPSQKISPEWAMGNPKAKPLPLWIKPDKKLTVRDVQELMRDHFEDSPMYLGTGIGAGPYKMPYRWRPMQWKHKGKEYIHERATSTQQTGFSFVAQSRGWLPDPIGGILWFGVDDTYMTVYVPMYCGITEAPRAFAVGTADFKTFSWDSAWWVFNFVANWTYSRYSDMIKDVQIVQREIEGEFQARLPEVDATAVKLYKAAPETARSFLTRYSAEQTEKTVTRWRKLGEQLLVKYLDGNVRDEKGGITHPAYPEDWYKAIVEESGDFFEWRNIPGAPPPPTH